MKKHLLTILLFLFVNGIYAEAVNSKAYQKRVELLGYLREIETIVKNYPGKPDDPKATPPQGQDKPDGGRLDRYKKIKRGFQEGLADYYEGNYMNSYRRFLEAQADTEQLLEELSEEFIEGTSEMLKEAVFKKDSKDYDNAAVDKELVDISVEYGKGSKNNREFAEDREAPYSNREYNPKDYHYTLNKYAIEQNTEYGYKALGQAKKARIEALNVERNLEKHQKIQPTHRKVRIEKYFAVIEKCRDARANAINIFMLKYPYDNYYLIEGQPKDKPVVLENTTMEFRLNPRAVLKNLNPVFDRRIPEKYRRDAVDLMGKVYEEEVDVNVKLKYDDKDYLNRNIIRIYNENTKLEVKETGATAAPAAPATAPAKK